MATLRQKRAIKEIVENRGVVSRAMVVAGYKRKTAKNPKNLTNSKAFKKELQPLLKRLEEERDAVIKRMKATRSKAKYRDLVDAVDKLTKNIQLLSGRATERVEEVVNNEQRKRLIAREAKRLGLSS